MDKDNKHIMIDIETMGTSCISAIASIGAVSFDMKGEIVSRYHMGVDLQSCVNAGLEIDASTVRWWLKQCKENQDRLLALKTKTLKEALLGLFDSFAPLNNFKTCVWSHGSNFDTVILENACKLVGVPVWWKYSNVRDTRTLFDVANYRYISKGGHDALDDAMNQANAVVDAYKQLMKGVM